jgi:single-strand DNA-binding protein
MEELLSKGKEVLVEGKLTNRSWDDKEGNKRYITEIVTSDFLILTPKTQSKTEEIPF